MIVTDTPSTSGTSGRRPRVLGATIWLMLVLALGLSVTAAATGSLASAGARTVADTPADTAVLDHAVSGVWTVVIPKGTYARMLKTGMAEYGMPPVVRLHVGDTIVLRNDDLYPHAVLDAYLEPGQTETRVLRTTGSEVYSAGCATMPTAIGFTSIFIAP